MKDIEQYLQESFGVKTHINNLDKASTSVLPLYLKNGYSFGKGMLLGGEVIWAEFQQEEVPSPEQLSNQQQQLRRYLTKPVIFVFARLEPWQRKRLIDRQVAFIQPQRQLYIPELMLQFSDTRLQERTSKAVIRHLSPPAQMAILYHLQKQSLELLALKEIAGLLSYSAMTMTRIYKELTDSGLVEPNRSRERHLHFTASGKELWQKSMPLFRSPVRETWYTDYLPPEKFYCLAGDSALSYYTMLAGIKLQNCAIGKGGFNTLRVKGVFEDSRIDHGENKFEIWLYDPLLLSNNRCVDKLSLFLSMQDEEDERIRNALQDLINGVIW